MPTVARKTGPQMSPKKAADDIGEVMERWARWRVFRARDELGFGECMTGKLLDGMPKIKCTCCVRGVQSINIKGTLRKIPCSACHGAEWVIPPIAGVKVNPKLIRATGGRYTDSTSLRVDVLYCELRAIHQSVIVEEYWHDGSRATKQDRVGVGRKLYERTLNEAHQHIRQGLSSSHT